METKKPWESRETVIGIIGLLLPFLVAAIYSATGIQVGLDADQIYEAGMLIYGIVIIGLIAIRNLWTQAKISLK